MTFVLVAFGGAIGAVLRYALGLALTFPYGTLAANALGCFAMGIALVVLMEQSARAQWAPFVMTGVLGGFTTYSAFALDTLKLFEAGQFASATGYAFGTFALAIVAVFAGAALARGLFL